MKKLIFLAVLLGLTGCGETDQNDTSQSTLQSSPASFNYYKAVSARTMSAPVASFGQWVVNGYASEGASTVLNANRIIGGVSTESKALITPNVSQVSKILKRGLGGFALTFAVDELLDGIDWVMDPANNRIRYKEPVGKCPYAVYGIEDRPVCGTTRESACKTYANGRIYQLIVNNTYCRINGTVAAPAGSTDYPISVDVTQIEEKNLPLDTVSQEIINNAESGNADAQAVTLAAAQAIVIEAENDATKAKEIEDDFERNYPKCPDGRSRNVYGQCFICGTAALEKKMRDDVQIAKGAHFGLGSCKATQSFEELMVRYNNYVNEATARDKLNVCYDVPHQPHLNQAKEAWRQAEEVCVAHMAGK